MEHFDLGKHLRPDSTFRNTLRNAHGLSSEQLNKAGSIITTALEKHSDLHPGETELTHKNFDKVMQIARKDPRFQDLHSAGDTFESAVREHLGIAPKEEA
jgi:hypothetical protein